MRQLAAARIGSLVAVPVLAVLLAGCAGAAASPAQPSSTPPGRSVTAGNPAATDAGIVRLTAGGGTARVAVRSCPLAADLPPRMNAWGLDCHVAARLPAGTPVRSACSVPTKAPVENGSTTWFSVVVPSGPGVRATTAGTSGWVWSGDTTTPRQVLPTCDRVGRVRHPVASPDSWLPDPVFAVGGRCTTAGGALTFRAAGLDPGSGLGFSVTTRDVRPYTNSRAARTGRVRPDGSATWRWPCAGVPAGTYLLTVAELSTGRTLGTRLPVG